MNFTSGLNKYNKIVRNSIAAKTNTIHTLTEAYKALEELYEKEIIDLLKQEGIIDKINQKLNSFSDYFANIDSYDINLVNRCMVIYFRNGDKKVYRIGSIREIAKNTFGVKEVNPIFYLLLGYIHENCLDALCLSAAMETYLDSTED